MMDGAERIHECAVDIANPHADLVRPFVRIQRLFIRGVPCVDPMRHEEYGNRLRRLARPFRQSSFRQLPDLDGHFL